MLDQLEQVRTQQTVSTSEHQNRVGAAEAGNLVDQVKALGGRELTGQRPLGRTGPAVLAGKLAGPGNLPEDQHRSLGEVKARTGHGPGDSSHEFTSVRRRTPAGG